MSHSGLSRRSFLGLSAGLAALGVPALAQAGPARTSRPRKQAKNIIFCVSDGMSLGVPAMAHQYLELAEGKSSVWTRLLQDPQITKGLMDTRSLSSLVTDSAAASSAWGSGVHHWNGMLNVLPDGRELIPLYRLLRERARMRTGLVTTATITHATPAGFAIAHSRRDEEAQIAAKYLDADVQVLMGGGRRFFSEALRTQFQQKGYQVHLDRSNPATMTAGQKFLGLYADGHLPYEVDRLNQFQIRRSVPALREMTEQAINMLNTGGEGFILQVEGARVDHAAHGNDFAGILHDQIAFESAVEYAMEFARQDGETLVVITSDHGNANPGLLGAGAEYGESTNGLRLTEKMRTSYDRLIPQMRGLNESQLRELIESQLGAKLTNEEAQILVMTVNGTHPLKPIEQYNTVSGMLALVLSNHSHIGWSGRQHTSDNTLVTAFGPGAEVFEGFQMNTSVFNRILAHRDITLQQASMTFEEASAARKDASVVRASLEGHWIDDPALS